MPSFSDGSIHCWGVVQDSVVRPPAHQRRRIAERKELFQLRKNPNVAIPGDGARRDKRFTEPIAIPVSPCRFFELGTQPKTPSPSNDTGRRFGRPLSFGGEGGIRTPGPLPVNGFQDRRFRPLSHLSLRAEEHSPIRSCRRNGARFHGCEGSCHGYSLACGPINLSSSSCGGGRLRYDRAQLG